MSAPDAVAPLDLQAIRLLGVTAGPVVERLIEVKYGDAEVLDQVLDGLVKLADEVERLRADLEEVQNDRAAAYLVEAQAWDLLDRAAGLLPDNVLADPEQPIPDHDLGQLRHDITRYLVAQPPEVARVLCGGCAPPRRSAKPSRILAVLARHCPSGSATPWPSGRP